MRILGIDFGKAKTGLAISEGSMATPYMVVGSEDEAVLIEKISQIVRDENIGMIVVGVSSGEMGEKSKEFAKRLRLKLKISVRQLEENYSTKMAQELAIEAGIKRDKRKRMEDAYAASLILQDYLDSSAS